MSIYQKYCTEVTDEQGRLQEFSLHYPQDFNFGYDVVDAIARETPNKKALVWCNTENEEHIFTFENIREKSNRMANVFRDAGIGQGDSVLLVLKRHYEYWFAAVALHKLGAVMIPATHMLTVKDFAYRIQASRAKAIVCTSQNDVPEKIRTALAETGANPKLWCVQADVEDFENLTAAMEAASSELDRVPTLATDPMLMYFTSGTTGYPKGVIHDFTYPLAHIVTAKYWHCCERDGLHLTISDTGWGKSLWGKLYGQWLCEGAVFVYDFDRFDENDILPMFAKYNITTFCAPPTMLRMLIRGDLSKFDLSSIHHMTTAGEALNPEVFKQFKDATGLEIMEGFGQTETTLAIANLYGTTPKVGAMGKASPQFDVDIVDPDGNSVATGEVGEIVIHTDKEVPCGLFKEYYLDPEKTTEAWHDDVYHTGDTAWRDEDGYFWYVGRVDDVIKSSGYRIGPFEIESVIMELPYVLECGVSAAPDEIRGQVVKASIVLTKGTEPTEELKKEIQNYVKSHTAPYKYPRIIVFKDELPKTISGKIQRNKL